MRLSMLELFSKTEPSLAAFELPKCNHTTHETAKVHSS